MMGEVLGEVVDGASEAWTQFEEEWSAPGRLVPLCPAGSVLRVAEEEGD